MAPSASPSATGWTPHRESPRTLLMRTIGIAVVAGGVLAASRGALADWPATAAVMLWPSLGGHFIEMWFLNWLRPRLSARRSVQAIARLTTWFVAGIPLALAMSITATALSLTSRSWLSWWWLGGVGLTAVELVAHLVLQLRGAPSFFNGRG